MQQADAASALVAVQRWQRGLQERHPGLRCALYQRNGDERHPGLVTVMERYSGAAATLLTELAQPADQGLHTWRVGERHLEHFSRLA